MTKISSKGKRLQKEHDYLESLQSSPWLTYFELFYLGKYSAITQKLRWKKKYRKVLVRRAGRKRRVRERRFTGYRARYKGTSPLTEFNEEPLNRILSEIGEREDMKPEEKQHLREHLRYLVRDKHRRQLKYSNPILRPRKRQS